MFLKEMKHTLQITLILLVFFLCAQLVGLAVIYRYVDSAASQAAGEVVFRELPVGERPPLDEKTSFVPVMAAILIGTVFILVLIRLSWMWIWKAWFLLAVTMALTIAGAAFLPRWLAAILALLAACWKTFRPGFWVQNLTELFIYGGMAAIFVPVFNLWSISILLVLIMGYDMYAVWKSKHMVTLATSQAKAKVFAGLLISYAQKGGVVARGRVQEGVKGVRSVPIRTAVLGGGDLGFPLLFAGVVFKEMGLWQSVVIPFFALLGLAFLLWIGKEKKFYPAMPFIGAGCFLGLLVVWGVGLL